jgi:hypothetical protein
MSLFRRGDMPEPAPAAFRGLGPAPGYTVKRFSDLGSLDAYLRANHVDANDAFNAHMFLGGVIPSKKEVALPAEGLLGDPDREAAVEAHEFTHTFGVVHRQGRGWFTGDGKRFDDLSPADQAAYVAKARQPPVAFNWNNVFAPGHAPTETAATQNIFRGR